MPMSPELFAFAADLVRKHEGKRNWIYFDPIKVPVLKRELGLADDDLQFIIGEGAITAGYGYNLSANGLPDDVIELLLAIKLNEAHSHLLKYNWYPRLSIRQQAALIDMVYEMGGAKFDDFTDMLAALAVSLFHDAHDAALDSAWACEVPQRAREDAELIVVG